MPSPDRLISLYKNRKVAVTGGASFIGSHLVELLVGSGASVTVVDDLSSGSLGHLASVRDSISFVQGDLRDAAFAQKSLNGNDIVFHLAAQHGGRGYIETHPVECMNNMLLDHIVYAAAAEGGASKIAFASSACVYPTNLQASSSSRLLLRETDANFEEPGKAFSDGEYGWAKLMGELQLRAFCKQYGVDGVACRIFTAYGERENESHAVVALIAKAVARMDPYPIWGDGLQTRNFTYVLDTVMGMALAAGTLTGFQTINVGSSHHHTILDLIESIFTHTGWRPSTIKKELDKPVGVLSRAADNSKCRELLGWEPSYTLVDGVGRTIDWYAATLDPARQARLEDLLLERR
jgi:UDP-glucose 4-epimerase